MDNSPTAINGELSGPIRLPTRKPTASASAPVSSPASAPRRATEELNQPGPKRACLPEDVTPLIRSRQRGGLPTRRPAKPAYQAGAPVGYE
jgi:hypothetical protein